MHFYRLFLLWFPLLTIPLWLYGQTVYEETFRWNGAGVQSEMGYIESLDLETEYESVAEYLAGEDKTMAEFLDELPWNNQWSDLANWQVLNEEMEWVAATVLPTMQDEVQVDATVATSFDSAMDIPATARAGYFNATGLTNNTSAQVVGNAEFGRIRLQVGTSNNRQSSFQINSGATLTVSGGGLDPTELSFHAPTSPRNTLSGSEGQLDFTGADVVLSSGSMNSGALWRFTNENSTITTSGAVLPISAFHATQEIVGTGVLSSSVQNLGTDPLANLSTMRIEVTGRNTTTNYVAGTYNSFFMSTLLPSITGAGNAHLDGDMYLAGSFLLNGEETALALRRTGTTQTPTSNLFTNGHRLEVLTDAQVVIGFADDGVGQSLLNFNGSEVIIPGTIIINDRGRLQGNATSVLSLGGDFLNFSTHVNTFNLTESTLEMAGGKDALTPQLLEVAGVNLGLDEDGFVNNFALGRLEVGTADTGTYVLLQDELDQSENGSDALYVTELFVHAGSTLNLNYLDLFTFDAENNLVQVVDGDTRFGDGLIIIPEPTTVAWGVLLLAGLIARRVVRRG